MQLHDVLEKAKLWRHLKDQWLLGAQEEGWKGKMYRSTTGNILGNETVVYDVYDDYFVMLDICH